MTVHSIRRLAFAAAFLFAPAAFSQDIQIAQIQKEIAEFNGKQFVLQMFRDDLPSKVVTDAPYSAEENSVTTQTLADGNRIVSSNSAKMFRDRLGRSRIEKTVEGSSVVTIDDPVAGTRYIVQEGSDGTKSATKLGNLKTTIDRRSLELSLKKSDEAKALNSGRPLLNGQPVNQKTEDLGLGVMEGLQVQGTRTVLTIPAGQIGNDRPIEVASERWFSPELQMVIMSKRSDPRFGETVYSVSNINRANPDASLFEVPAGPGITQRLPGKR